MNKSQFQAKNRAVFSDAENMHRVRRRRHRPRISPRLVYPGHGPPLGKPIQINGVSYEFIGVLEPRKGRSSRIRSADKAVMVPYAPITSTSWMTTANTERHRRSRAAVVSGDQIRGVVRRRRNCALSIRQL